MIEQIKCLIQKDEAGKEHRNDSFTDKNFNNIIILTINPIGSEKIHGQSTVCFIICIDWNLQT